MAITEQDIIKAAEELVAEGTKPSPEKVREKLGDTGSYSTISPVLRKWKKSKEIQSTALIEMPNAVKEAINRVGADIWLTASKIASEQLATLRKESLEQIDEANTERDQADAEVKRLEESHATLETKLSENEKEKKALTKSLADAEKLIARLEAKLEDREEHIKSLNVQLESSRIQYDKAHDEMVAMSKQLAELAKAASKQKGK